MIRGGGRPKMTQPGSNERDDDVNDTGHSQQTSNASSRTSPPAKRGWMDFWTNPRTPADIETFFVPERTTTIGIVN